MPGKVTPETWSIREFKQVAFQRVTADAVVHRGPAFVFSLTIHSNGDGESDADVYDGISAGGRKMFDLYCVDEAMDQLRFNPPVYFDRAIFVDVGTNCEAVTVQYLPAP